MEKLIFTLILIVIAGVIYLITGRNKRQINRIPEGMTILCEPPGKRYLVYALAVFVVLFVGFFNVLYIMDGAPGEARGMWTLSIAVTILSSGIMIFAGNAMARECTYFNEDQIQIERPFRKARIVKWHEIRKMKGSFDNMFHLYLMDGTKILTVHAGMVNYELFCNSFKKNSPDAVKGYYRTNTYETPKKCILRYGTEYYLMAGMGILLMLMFIALTVPADDFDLMQQLTQKLAQRDLSGLFSLLFAPVCGVVSVIYLFVMSQTKIRYSDEKLILKYPFRRKKELYWRNIQKIRLRTTHKRGEETCKKMWICTDHAKYKINFELLNYGKDDFITQVEKMAEKYDIFIL